MRRRKTSLLFFCFLFPFQLANWLKSKAARPNWVSEMGFSQGEPHSASDGLHPNKAAERASSFQNLRENRRPKFRFCRSACSVPAPRAELTSASPLPGCRDGARDRFTNLISTRVLAVNVCQEMIQL